MFDDLIACIAGHHAVDARRVYVAGHSAGGAMTNYVLGRRSSLLAGGITGRVLLDQRFRALRCLVRRRFAGARRDSLAIAGRVD